MSAQLSQHQSTRLLIAEKSENAAHELDSTLRDAGIATKLCISDDLAHISQMLSQDEADIALLTDKIDGLEQMLPRIRANSPHTPLLILSHSEQPMTVAEAISLGATDVIPANHPDQLALVVKRELEHVCQHRHFSQVRRALKEAEQRCQLLLQGSKAAIAYVHEGMHIHANEGYLNLFGFSDVDELCGVSLVDLLATESAEQLKLQLKNLRNGADEALFEFASNDYVEHPVKGTMSLANSQYEGEACLQITVRKQTANNDSEASDAAPTSNGTAPVEDSLALPGFVKAAQTLFNNADGKHYVFALQLDQFTQLQQGYGWLGVDIICRKLWQTLSELAEDHPVTRLNNHLFALALSASSRDHALNAADSLRQKLSEIILEVQDKTVRPTVTFAAAEVEGEVDVNQATDLAYNELLDALEKEASNCVVMPSEAVAEVDENDDANIILRQITEAIEKKMFVLLFQPIISLRGDSDEHYEVFLRMTNENGEQIEPGRFLQTAIDNNVAGKIDRWVILQSIKMLSVHRAKGHATRLTINLTCNSVSDPEFLQWLTVAIKAARLPSDAVIFQITEKDAVTYLRQTREFVEGLRGMHCRASLSRFGLIEDPFETLRHVPVDMVKLDGSRVVEQTDTLVDCISRLQSTGKLTVVPMVENANVLSMLWQAGANYIQGHYLQEPSTEMDYDFSTEE